ncbi:MULTISPECIES: glycosyltransferase [unclassified Carboxylicivirga]|uniref:glycosyltransferase n=1 Tax=Carboxylicivirga TaxID=1628153 RepID=UPI003D325D74
MKQRIEIFLKYCLSGVKNQTRNNFTWLIYIDALTPKWALKQLENHVPDNTHLLKVSLLNR